MCSARSSGHKTSEMGTPSFYDVADGGSETRRTRRLRGARSVSAEADCWTAHFHLARLTRRHEGECSEAWALRVAQTCSPRDMPLTTFPEPIAFAGLQRPTPWFVGPNKEAPAGVIGKRLRNPLLLNYDSKHLPVVLE